MFLVVLRHFRKLLQVAIRGGKKRGKKEEREKVVQYSYLRSREREKG